MANELELGCSVSAEVFTGPEQGRYEIEGVLVGATQEGESVNYLFDTDKIISVSSNTDQLGNPGRNQDYLILPKIEGQELSFEVVIANHQGGEIIYRKFSKRLTDISNESRSTYNLENLDVGDVIVSKGVIGNALEQVGVVIECELLSKPETESADVADDWEKFEYEIKEPLQTNERKLGSKSYQD